MTLWGQFWQKNWGSHSLWQESTCFLAFIFCLFQNSQECDYIIQHRIFPHRNLTCTNSNSCLCPTACLCNSRSRRLILEGTAHRILSCSLNKKWLLWKELLSGLSANKKYQLYETTVINFTLWFGVTGHGSFFKDVHLVAVVVSVWDWFVINAGPSPRHISARTFVWIEAVGIARPSAPWCVLADSWWRICSTDVTIFMSFIISSMLVLYTQEEWGKEGEVNWGMVTMVFKLTWALLYPVIPIIISAAIFSLPRLRAGITKRGQIFGSTLRKSYLITHTTRRFAILAWWSLKWEEEEGGMARTNKFNNF